MQKQEKFVEIWNEAYNIYTDAGRTDSARYNDMQRYLEIQVKNGSIGVADKAAMVKDIKETAGL